MAKTKYACVYTDEKGEFYYVVDLGRDKVTGKRIQKKSKKDKYGNKFSSAKVAYREVTRLKNEFHQLKGYSNYHLTYGEFMNNYYLVYYKGNVQESTWGTRKHLLYFLRDRFFNKKLREFDIIDCETFRTWLLTDSSYSQNYSSMVYGGFRQSLDYALKLGFINENISKRTKAISKTKTIIKYWTKNEFQKVISVIFKRKYYEHMCFVAIWLYYMTGIRVSEGLALNWNDVDFEKSKLRIHGTLDYKNSKNYRVKPYTKTVDGMRIITLDKETIEVLKEWKSIQQGRGINSFILSYDDSPLDRKIINRMVHRYSKIAKVSKIQAKGLRHSHVSYLINEFNADILVVSKRLGHSSPEITLKHYAHLWGRNDELLAKKMNGNIIYKEATESRVDFMGNQSIKNELVTFQKPTNK